jgi:hypothetical protein
MALLDKLVKLVFYILIMGLITLTDTTKNDGVEQGLLYYSRFELLHIGRNCKKGSNRYRIEVSTMINIKMCNVQKKRKKLTHPRGKRGGQQQKRKRLMDLLEFNRTSNMNNNILIERSYDYSVAVDKRINFGLINAQSIKNKEILIMNTVRENKIDFVIITETWMRDEHRIWLEGSEFNSNGYTFYGKNRQDRKGGGVGITVNTQWKCSEVNYDVVTHFEFGIWRLSYGSLNMDLLVVYRPPYSQGNPIISQFTYELCVLLERVIPQSRNLIMLVTITYT